MTWAHNRAGDPYKMHRVREHCPTCGEPDWPWRELDELSSVLTAELGQRVARIMREAGEDPDNTQLFTTRVAQAANGIASRAERNWKEAVRS